MQNLSVYVAGPDVFYEDASERFAYLVRLLGEAGLLAVVPGEASGGVGFGSGRMLYEENVRRLQGSGAVLANLSAFRGGTEPDSGTCVEVGMALMLGKVVVGYCDGWEGESWGDRIREAHGSTESGVDREYGCLVEDFEGMGLNLMLSSKVELFRTREEAVRVLKRRLTESC